MDKELEKALADSFILIKDGIANRDWELILDAYCLMSGEDLTMEDFTIEEKKSDLESLREKIKSIYKKTPEETEKEKEIVKKEYRTPTKHTSVGEMFKEHSKKNKDVLVGDTLDDILKMEAND